MTTQAIPSHNGAFFSRPEQEQCQAQLAGCNGSRRLIIHCTVEGTDISVCAPCAATWRLNATAQSLYNRCPRCAQWNPGTKPSVVLRPARGVLQGSAADAINSAMHAEGLTVDIRDRVLARLANEHAWLGNAVP